MLFCRPALICGVFRFHRLPTSDLLRKKIVNREINSEFRVYATDFADFCPFSAKMTVRNRE
jgi:hypothetical protein